MNGINVKLPWTIIQQRHLSARCSSWRHRVSAICQKRGLAQKMNKTKLAQRLAETTGLSRNKSRIVLNAILSEITEQTFCHPRTGVQIEGFGEFRVIRGNHSGRINLTTGERLTYPGPVLKMAFRPDPKLKMLRVVFGSQVPEKYIGSAGQPVPNSEDTCL